VLTPVPVDFPAVPAPVAPPPAEPAVTLVFAGAFPMFQPQERRVLTNLGVTAAVRGTRMKMKDLWMAYARASWVQRPARS
jgi:hypothetical protein